jgi:ABC-type uncharacterized transport system substrate-binding protein
VEEDGMILAMEKALRRVAAACRFRSRTAAVAVVTLALAARAPGGEVVVVLSGDAAPYAAAEAGFESQFAGKRAVRAVQIKDLAGEGVGAGIGKNADAVVAVGTVAATYLHRELPAGTPLLYCMVADPAQAGLLQGNAAQGVTTGVPIAAQFALAAEALPRGHTVGILYRSNTAEGAELLKKVADSLPKGWRLEAVAVDKYQSVADAIDDLTGRQVDLIWTTLETGIYDYPTVRALLLAALRNNIPVFGYSPAFVKAGALLGVGIDPRDQGKQAAEMTARLLDKPAGAASPGAVPPEQYQIAVNLIVADKIGVELPQDLIGRATYVFKEGK